MKIKMKILLFLVCVGLIFVCVPACDKSCDDCKDDCAELDQTDDDDQTPTPVDPDDDDDDFVDTQVEYTEPTQVLNSDGSLHAQGWARTPLFQYNPENIPSGIAWRKKEWDHFTIVAPTFAFTITVSDIQIATFIGFELIDFATGELISGTTIQPGSHGTFPLSPLGETYFSFGDNFVRMQYEQGVRTITAHIDDSLLSPKMDCDITLTQMLPDENVAAVAPFSKKGTFFYENKIFGMPVAGQVTVDGEQSDFDPDETYGVLDWGRGVWPHSTDWHWGFAAGMVDGEILAINIGDGWSDDSRGTANAQKYSGTVHKLFNVYFDYDPNGLMEPWEITSDQEKLETTLVPFFHQNSGLIILDIGMLVDKMYGTFSGRITLDDGTVIPFENLYGFIEHSTQKW